MFYIVVIFLLSAALDWEGLTWFIGVWLIAYGIYDLEKRILSRKRK